MDPSIVGSLPLRPDPVTPLARQILDETPCLRAIDDTLRGHLGNLAMLLYAVEIAETPAEHDLALAGAIKRARMAIWLLDHPQPAA